MSATASPNSPADPRRSPAPRCPGRADLGADGILDARRALFLPGPGTLVIADVHLGYAWVQRRRGALLPVNGPGAALERLTGLLRDYPVQHLLVLGDLVHQAVSLPAVVGEMTAWMQRIPAACALTVCTGNHDRGLATFLEALPQPRPVSLVTSWVSGRHRFHHGDRTPDTAAALEYGDWRDVIGHEHPSIRLGDGVATEAKVPCFLVGHRVSILPAFSDWAAGCELGRQPFLGETARRAEFHAAYACLGPRLLRIPLKTGSVHPGGTSPTSR